MKKLLIATIALFSFASSLSAQSSTYLGTSSNTVIVRNKFRITKLVNNVAEDSMFVPTVTGDFKLKLIPSVSSGEPIIAADSTNGKYWNGYKHFVDFSTDSIAQGATNKWYSDALVQAYSDTRYATLASPALTGVPTGPTAAFGTNTTQLATTEFVLANAVTGGTGVTSVTATNGTGQTWTITGTTTKNLALALTKNAVGLSNVNNTDDASKPISILTQNALNLKAPIANPTFTGTVSGITATMVGLGSVNNTSDLNKIISTATQTALDLKSPILSPTFTGTPLAPTATAGTNTTQIATTAFVATAITNAGTGAGTITDVTATDGVGQTFTITGTASKNIALALTKASVGLSNVDNTTDINKSISTLTQTALNLKANLASPTFSGTVVGITKSMVGLGNVDNTTDAGKPVSTLTQTALDLKANLASPSLTGSPTAPTATIGDSTTKIATTAFTDAAVTAGINALAVFTITSGTTAPSSTPVAIGDMYINTSATKVYIATGITSSVDWKILN